MHTTTNPTAPSALFPCSWRTSLKQLGWLPTLLLLAALLSSCDSEPGEPWRAVVDAQNKVRPQQNRNMEFSQLYNNPYVLQARFALLRTLAMQSADNKLDLYLDPQTQKAYPQDSFRNLMIDFAQNLLGQLRNYRPMAEYYSQAPDTFAPWFHAPLDTLARIEDDSDRFRYADSLMSNLLKLQPDAQLDFDLLLHEDWRLEEGEIIKRTPKTVEIVFQAAPQMLAQPQRYTVCLPYTEFAKLDTGLQVLALAGGFQEEKTDLEHLLNSRRHVFRLVGLARQTEGVQAVPRDANGQYMIPDSLPKGFELESLRLPLSTDQLFERYPTHTADVLDHIRHEWLPLFPNSPGSTQVLSDEERDSLQSPNKQFLPQAATELVEAILEERVPIYLPVDRQRVKDTTVQMEVGQFLVELFQRNGVEPQLDLLMKMRNFRRAADVAASAAFRNFVMGEAMPHLSKVLELRGQLVRTPDTLYRQYTHVRLYYLNPDRRQSEMAVCEIDLADLDSLAQEGDAFGWVEKLRQDAYWSYLVEINGQEMRTMAQSILVNYALLNQPWEMIAANPFAHADYQDQLARYEQDRDMYHDILLGRFEGAVSFERPETTTLPPDLQPEPQPAEPGMTQPQDTAPEARKPQPAS